MGATARSKDARLGSQAEVSGKARTRSVVLFCASMFFFWAAHYVYVPLLPVYATHLGASLTMVGLAVGIFGFIQLPERVPLGAWSDHLGRRKPFVLLGIASTGIGGLAMVLGADPWYLVGGRTVAGIGAGTWVCASVLLSSYFPPKEATKAMGLGAFLLGAAQVLVGPLGGWLAETYDWLAPFYAAVGLAALSLLFMLGVDDPPVRSHQSMTWERFRRIGTVPLLLVVSAIGWLTFFAFFATAYTFTPVYAQGIGASKTDLGMLMSVTMLAYSISSLLAFRLSNWLGDRTLVALSLLLGAASIFVTPFIGDLPLLMASLFVGGFARGILYPLLMSLSVRGVAAEDQATSMGIFQAVYAFGVFCGPFLGGVMADQVGLTSVFAVSTVACLAGAVLAAQGIRQPRPAPV